MDFEQLNQGDLIQWLVFFIGTKEQYEKHGKAIVELMNEKIDEVLKEAED